MEVIIGAIVAIGSGIMNLIASNRQSAALEAAAAEQRAAAEITADASRYSNDIWLLGTQFDAAVANEKNENTNASFQVGILIIGIVAVGIIAFVMKRLKVKK